MGGKGGNVMRDNLDYERKDYLEKETIKKKKGWRDNPDSDEKEQLRKYKKKRKESYV